MFSKNSFQKMWKLVSYIHILLFVNFLANAEGSSADNYSSNKNKADRHLRFQPLMMP